MNDGSGCEDIFIAVVVHAEIRSIPRKDAEIPFPAAREMKICHMKVFASYYVKVVGLI